MTLNYFRATWQPDLETVVIEWQTATELNTAGFVIERSTSPTTGFAAITDVIPAVGDQLAGWTYDPVADDPATLVLGVTYWYRLLIINTTPPNDVIPAVAVVAGTTVTVTPTRTPTTTPTMTPTPSGTPMPVGVSLTPSTARLAGTPGQILIQILHLLNGGDVTRKIDLLHNSSRYPVIVSPLSVELPPDMGIDVIVMVFVPSAPTAYTNTTDVVAIVHGAAPLFSVSRIETVVWRQTYVPTVIR